MSGVERDINIEYTKISNKVWESKKKEYNEKIITIKLGYDEQGRVIDDTPINIYNTVKMDNYDELEYLKVLTNYIINKYLISFDNIKKLCSGCGYYNNKIFIINIKDFIMELVLVPDKLWISYINIYKYIL